MTSSESKLLIKTIDRVDQRMGNMEKELGEIRADVSKLKSFKVQVVAWGAGAATTLGVVFPKALEWISGAPRH